MYGPRSSHPSLLERAQDPVRLRMASGREHDLPTPVDQIDRRQHTVPAGLRRAVKARDREIRVDEERNVQTLRLREPTLARQRAGVDPHPLDIRRDEAV